jgi:dihydrofolate reductase
MNTSKGEVLMAIVSIIVATGLEGEIGQDNKLLWDIPNDMSWFKEKTKGKVVIMGRKTHESIGKLLPDRVNVVISNNPHYRSDFEQAVVKRFLGPTLMQFKDEDEIMIIGGAEVYKWALSWADRIYLTRVLQRFPRADAYFPEINYMDYQIAYASPVFPADLDLPNNYSHQFKILERIKES